ncbi:hypothetical protein ACSBR2_042044 [Camellia fascicularis]
MPSMDSLKILIWNCQGNGNNTFRRKKREVIRNHNPGILILMETKVTYSSMGNFFNNLGYTASTVIDPAGRARGIWLIWDTDQVNVRALAASNQYIQATVHKEDYEEWVLNAIYASTNPIAGDSL